MKRLSLEIIPSEELKALGYKRPVLMLQRELVSLLTIPADRVKPTAPVDNRFAEKVANLMQEVIHNSQVVAINPVRVHLHIPGERSQDLGLTQLLADCTKAPEEADSLIADFVEGIAQSSIKEQDLKRELVVPVLKSAKTKTRNEVKEMLNSEIIVLYGVDLEHMIHYPSSEVMKKLVPDQKQIRKLAIRNLVRIHRSFGVTTNDKGVHQITVDLNYNASFVLMPEIWDKARYEIKGEFVIAVPHMRLLLFTDSENKAGVTWLRQVTKMEFGASREGISDELFTFVGDKLVVYKEEEGNAAG